MATRLIFCLAISALALGGANCATPARNSDLVIEVTASYPGASAQVVADAVASPIEHNINGVEELLRIESESTSEGKYLARLYFSPKAEPRSTKKLVQNRVDLAVPALPEVVRENKVSVRVGKPESDADEVVIAVIDRQGRGWDALRKAADAVVKRLATDGALAKPQAYFQLEQQFSIDIDRAKCAALGVSVDDVSKAFQAAVSDPQPDVLKKVMVSDKVALEQLAVITEVPAPVAIHRIDLYPAIRITGKPSEGKPAAEVAAKCVDLAETEITLFEGIAVMNLSTK